MMRVCITIMLNIVRGLNACFYLLIDNWSHGGVYSSHLTSHISIYMYNLYARTWMANGYNICIYTMPSNMRGYALC